MVELRLHDRPWKIKASKKSVRFSWAEPTDLLVNHESKITFADFHTTCSRKWTKFGISQTLITFAIKNQTGTHQSLSTSKGSKCSGICTKAIICPMKLRKAFNCTLKLPATFPNRNEWITPKHFVILELLHETKWNLSIPQFEDLLTVCIQLESTALFVAYLARISCKDFYSSFCSRRENVFLSHRNLFFSLKNNTINFFSN